MAEQEVWGQETRGEVSKLILSTNQLTAQVIHLLDAITGNFDDLIGQLTEATGAINGGVADLSVIKKDIEDTIRKAQEDMGYVYQEFLTESTGIKGDISSLSGSVTQIRDSIGQLSTDSVFLTSKYGQLQGLSTSLQGEISLYKSQVDNLQQSVISVDQHVEVLKAELQNVSEMTQGNAESASNFEALLNELSLRVTKMTEDTVTYTATAKDLVDKYNAMKSVADESSTRANEAIVLANQAVIEVSALNTRVFGLQEIAADIQSRIAEYGSMADEINGKLATGTAEATSLKNFLESTTDDINNRLGYISSQIADANVKVNAINIRLDAVTSTLDGISALVGDMNTTVSQRLEEAMQVIEDAKGIAPGLASSIEDANARLINYTQSLSGAKADVDAIFESLHTYKTETDTTYERVTLQLADLTDKMDSLTTFMNTSLAQVNAANAEMQYSVIYIDEVREHVELIANEVETIYLKKVDQAADSALIGGKDLSYLFHDDNAETKFAASPMLSQLKTDVANIQTLLGSDNSNLDTLQEIVDFIQTNKATLDSLAISNIAGLQTALDGKLGVDDNATSASKWAAARKITLDGAFSGETTFDGSTDVTLTATIPGVDKVNGLVEQLALKLDQTGVAADSALIGGKDLSYLFHDDNAETKFAASPMLSQLKTDVANIQTLLGSDNSNLDTLQEIVDFIQTNKATLDSLAISNIAGLQTALDGKLDVDANAVSASKWATARNITLAGAFSGEATIDGSTDVTLTATIPGVDKVDGLVEQLALKLDKTDVAADSALIGGKDLSYLFHDDNAEVKLGVSPTITQIKSDVTAIQTLLGSDNSNLDTLQEIVDFIQMNKATLDTLNVSSIAGLQTALDGKLGVADNAASASKWNVARKIALSNALSGFVDIDGSGDVVLDATITGMDKVPGLVDQLATKMGITDTAVNSVKLNGIEAARFFFGDDETNVKAVLASSIDGLTQSGFYRTTDTNLSIIHMQRDDSNAVRIWWDPEVNYLYYKYKNNGTWDTTNFRILSNDSRLDFDKLDNVPVFATRANTWDEVTDKPTTFTATDHTHLWDEVTDKPAAFTPVAHTHIWDEVTGKPTTFTPSPHNHYSVISEGLVVEQTGTTEATYAGLSIADAVAGTAWVDGTRVGNIINAKGNTSSQLMISPNASNTPSIYVRGKLGEAESWSTWARVLTTADIITWDSIDSKPTTLAGFGITDGAPLSHVGAGGTAHSEASTSVAGFMSAADKTKLDGIAAGANAYVHPTGDGNLHVPVTGTDSNGYVLKAGATAGSMAWSQLTAADVGALPSTWVPIFADIAYKPTTLSGYGITDAQPLASDLTAIAGLAGTSGLLKKTAANTWALDTNTYLTNNQTITISGDATGTGSTAISLVLANSGAIAGTYKSVTVDSKGRVTSGTNPTTLAEYGIIDAIPSSSKGGVNGIATLDATGKVPADQLPLDAVQSVDGLTGMVVLPLATEAAPGKAAIATTAEVATGTNDTKFITPAKLAGYAQRIDATLTAMSGVATAADKLIYFNGVDTATSATLTAFARTLLDDTSAAGAQATLGVLANTRAFKTPADVATTANLTATYTNGTSGAGARLTNSGPLAALVIDGVTAAVNMRVLVKDQTAAAQNGIYTVTNIGSASVAWILTRATDSDVTAELAAAVISVDQGTANGAVLFKNDWKKTYTVGTTEMLWKPLVDTGNFSAIHPDSGVTAGTYTSVTVNDKGHVTAGTNPTTEDWTPSIAGMSTAGTYTLSTAVGKVSRSGNIVTLSGHIVVSSGSGGEGMLLIKGVPIPKPNDNLMHVGSVMLNGVTFTGSPVLAFRTASASSTELYVALQKSGYIADSVNITDIVPGALIHFSITYTV